MSPRATLHEGSRLDRPSGGEACDPPASSIARPARSLCSPSTENSKQKKGGGTRRLRLCCAAPLWRPSNKNRGSPDGRDQRATVWTLGTSSTAAGLTQPRITCKSYGACMLAQVALQRRMNSRAPTPCQSLEKSESEESSSLLPSDEASSSSSSPAPLGSVRASTTIHPNAASPA